MHVSKYGHYILWGLIDRRLMFLMLLLWYVINPELNLCSLCHAVALITGVNLEVRLGLL